MSLDPVKNFAKVEVSQGYDAAATSIVLETDEGAKLPQPSTDGAFNLVWWNSTDYPDPADDPNKEIVRCTARSTDTLTVIRNQEDSGASTKNESGKTYKMILAMTEKMIDDIKSDFFPEYKAGDNVTLSMLTERSTSATSWTKLKEAIIGKNGTLRISFNLKSGHSAQTVYGRVYRKGSGVGTTRSTNSTSYVNYSEDISGWTAGDTVQLYTYCGAGGLPSYVSAFIIKTDKINDIIVTD